MIKNFIILINFHWVSIETMIRKFMIRESMRNIISNDIHEQEIHDQEFHEQSIKNNTWSWIPWAIQGEIHDQETHDQEIHGHVIYEFKFYFEQKNFFFLRRKLLG